MDSDKTLKRIKKEWYGLELTDYAKGIAPFVTYGKTDADLFVSIVGHFVNDAAMENCKILNNKPDTQYRYVNGTPIPKKGAEYLYQNRDPQKYSRWISDCMDETDSYEAVQNWLKTKGYPGKYPDDECEQALEDILIAICGSAETKKRLLPYLKRALNSLKISARRYNSFPDLPLSLFPQ